MLSVIPRIPTNSDRTENESQRGNSCGDCRTQIAAARTPTNCEQKLNPNIDAATVDLLDFPAACTPATRDHSKDQS